MGYLKEFVVYYNKMELINHVISKLERIKNEYDRDLDTF